MKKDEIKQGQCYRAKVNGVLTTVRVLGIRTVEGHKGYFGPVRSKTVYDVQNLRTGRQLIFRSASRFVRSVESDKED